MPGSSKWSISLLSPSQDPAYTFPVSRTCHMPCLSHYSWLDQPNNILWAGKFMRLFFMYKNDYQITRDKKDWACSSAEMTIA
jgi:hypothetical protein